MDKSKFQTAEEIEKIIKDFADLLKKAPELHNYCYEQVGVANETMTDIQHTLELCELSRNEKAKTMTFMQKTLDDRREYKDQKLVYEPIVNWIDSEPKLVSRIDALLSSARKSATSIDNRYYNNRQVVFKDNEWVRVKEPQREI